MKKTEIPNVYTKLFYPTTTPQVLGYFGYSIDLGEDVYESEVLPLPKD